jgi:hypothetical protein
MGVPEIPHEDDITDRGDHTKLCTLHHDAKQQTEKKTATHKP